MPVCGVGWERHPRPPPPRPHRPAEHHEGRGRGGVGAVRGVLSRAGRGPAWFRRGAAPGQALRGELLDRQAGLPQPGEEGGEGGSCCPWRRRPPSHSHPLSPPPQGKGISVHTELGAIKEVLVAVERDGLVVDGQAVASGAEWVVQVREGRGGWGGRQWPAALPLLPLLPPAEVR